jgi:hypothetical protein
MLEQYLVENVEMLEIDLEKDISQTDSESVSEHLGLMWEKVRYQICKII